MSWNYRVVHEVHDGGEETWTICEVYYKPDGVTPRAYGPRTGSPMANDLDDRDKGWKASLGWTLDRMRDALEKPVLEAAEIA